MTDEASTMGTRQKLPYKVSPSNKIHLFSDMETPDCGQTIGGEWSHIIEDEMLSPGEVAEKYAHLRFCSKCFARSWALNRTAREIQNGR